MAEAKGPKTEKSREAARESWQRGAEVMGRVMGMKLPPEKPEGVGPSGGHGRGSLRERVVA